VKRAGAATSSAAGATVALRNERNRGSSAAGSLLAPLLTARNNEARVPPGRPSARRRPDSFRWQTASGEQPRDHGVRIPHFARPELIAAPDWCWHGSNEVEEATRLAWVIAQALRTCDSLVGVRNDAVPPAAQLVPKNTEARSAAAADWAFANDAARCTIGITDRCHLDHEASLRHAHLKRGVVQVQRPPPLKASLDGLEYAPVQPNGTAARAERQPIQVDAGLVARPVACADAADIRFRHRHSCPTPVGNLFTGDLGPEERRLGQTPPKVPPPESLKARLLITLKPSAEYRCSARGSFQLMAASFARAAPRRIGRFAEILFG
jgi:hypothetical protein